MNKVKAVTEMNGEINRTFGTGTGKTTMALHIKKNLYKSLGWDIGDMVLMIPNVKDGTLTIKRIDLEKMR